MWIERPSVWSTSCFSLRVMDSADNNSMRRRSRHSPRNVLLALLTTVVVLGALKISQPVSLPLAFSLFLIAIFWPLQHRLEQRLTTGWAAVINLLIVIFLLALFGGALLVSYRQVMEKWPRYEQQYQRYRTEFIQWSRQWGFLEENGSAQTQSSDQEVAIRQQFALAAGEITVRSFGFILLTTALMVLGLLQGHKYQDKFDDRLSGVGRHWTAPLQKISTGFRRYIIIRSAIGLITGTFIYLFCLLIGLDFALIWGLTNFLLNYIPTIGSIVAVVPPVLFALFQFESLPMAALTLLGVGGVQFVMGNYVDPLTQGRFLKLSPFVVLLSVTFWGWFWGVGGAFISVPLTVAVVIACNQFPRTRWIAVLLADIEREEPRDS